MRTAALLAFLGVAACERLARVEPGPMERYAARLQAGCAAGDQTACQQAAYTGGLTELERCQRWHERRNIAAVGGGLFQVMALDRHRPAGC